MVRDAAAAGEKGTTARLHQRHHNRRRRHRRYLHRQWVLRSRTTMRLREFLWPARRWPLSRHWGTPWFPFVRRTAGGCPGFRYGEQYQFGAARRGLTHFPPARPLLSVASEKNSTTLRI